jgi:hypothetical protein
MVKEENPSKGQTEGNEELEELKKKLDEQKKKKLTRTTKGKTTFAGK